MCEGESTTRATTRLLEELNTQPAYELTSRASRNPNPAMPAPPAPADDGHGGGHGEDHGAAEHSRLAGAEV